MQFSKQDSEFMQRALVLAKRGSFHVSPNPKVGAVFVSRGRIIGEGFHKIYGGLHAEVLALRSVKKNEALKGSTLYVNIEPCVWYEKKNTPPCVEALIQAKIARVVIAMQDPNPKVNGRGVRMLRRAGIRVDIGCLKAQAEKLNEHFIVWQKTRMPYVAMKVAMSLDGKIATKTGDSKWITSEQSRSFAHKLRDSYDAILIGANTAICDNPTLSGARREPRRIVLDSELRIPFSSNIYRDSNVLVITTVRAPQTKISQLKKRGIPYMKFPQKIAIASLLRHLGKYNISSIFVEGGAEIFGSFLDARRINKLYWFVAPMLVGGKKAVTAVAGKGSAYMKNALRLSSYEISLHGGDLLITAHLDASSKR